MNILFKTYTLFFMGIGIVVGVIVAPLFLGFGAALDWYAKKIATTQ
jgi:hypothetical protein